MVIGNRMYALAEKLYPIYRSITGNGVRETFEIIKEYIGEEYPLQVYEVPTGTKVFDWTIPKEWEIKNAYIEDEEGNIICSFKNNCLHVVGYSIPVDKWVTYEELLEHIYTQPNQPDVIPYVTSYYKEWWGFCLSEDKKRSLKKGKYHVKIESRLFDGSLSFAELVIPGRESKEVLFSTYSCHPSMANDNCSGLVLSAEIARHIIQMKERRYTYRFVFLPETIGAITYISHDNNLSNLKKNVIAGYTFSCVGDDGDYSIINSKTEDSLSDRALINVLENMDNNNYKRYSYLQRGSDERQYNSPGVDLSIVGFCRTKYWEFPEYHTSEDTLDYISPEGLMGSFDVMCKVIEIIEYNARYRVAVPCEPQLGKRGLYPNISQKDGYNDVVPMMDFIAFADGKEDLVEISRNIGQPASILIPIIRKLKEEGLLIIMEDT